MGTTGEDSTVYRTEIEQENVNNVTKNNNKIPPEQNTVPQNEIEMNVNNRTTNRRNES